MIIDSFYFFVLIYFKIVKFIMARYHDIFKYVCNDIRPSERSIQRYRKEYEHYFEVLLQITLKKIFDE